MATRKSRPTLYLQARSPITLELHPSTRRAAVLALTQKRYDRTYDRTYDHTCIFLAHFPSHSLRHGLDPSRVFLCSLLSTLLNHPYHIFLPLRESEELYTYKSFGNVSRGSLATF